MRPLRPAAGLLLLATAALPASEPPVGYLAAGVTYFTDADSRELVEEDGSWEWSNNQRYAFGISAPQRALVGFPWIDLEWNHAEGDDHRIDSFGVLYTERAFISASIYLGAGLGSFYQDVRLETGAGRIRDDEWTIGGKLVAGIWLDPFILEGVFQWIPSDIADVDTSLYAVQLGFAF